MLRPVKQMIDNRLVQFSCSSFIIVDFQRPHGVCNSFSTALKFTGLIQISYINERGELFFFQTNGTGIFCGGFGGESLLFDCESCFFQ